MAKRTLTTTGVRVRLKPCCYWRDKSANVVFRGPTGRPGTARYSPGDGEFVVPAAMWQRQSELPERERIMEKVADAPASD